MVSHRWQVETLAVSASETGNAEHAEPLAVRLVVVSVDVAAHAIDLTPLLCVLPVCLVVKRRQLTDRWEVSCVQLLLDHVLDSLKHVGIDAKLRVLDCVHGAHLCAHVDLAHHQSSFSSLW